MVELKREGKPGAGEGSSGLPELTPQRVAELDEAVKRSGETLVSDALGHRGQGVGSEQRVATPGGDLETKGDDREQERLVVPFKKLVPPDGTAAVLRAVKDADGQRGR